MPVEGECSSKAVKSALKEKLARGKLDYKGLKAEDCYDLRVLDWVKSKPKPVPLKLSPLAVEGLEGLSGLALVARKLRLAHDVLPTLKGRINPSLGEDGSVRFYD